MVLFVFDVVDVDAVVVVVSEGGCVHRDREYGICIRMLTSKSFYQVLCGRRERIEGQSPVKANSFVERNPVRFEAVVACGTKIANLQAGFERT